MDGLTVLRYKEYIWDLGCSYRSKAKPILLMSVFELIHSGKIADNHIVLDVELISAYKDNWRKYGCGDKITPINYPLYHLSGDSFWHFVEFPGMTVKPASVHSPSMKRIRDCVEYFCVDDDLFEQLKDEVAYNMLTQTLIEKHLR